MNIFVIGPTYPYKGGISHFTTLLVHYLRKNHAVNFISWKRQYPAFLYPVELKDTQSKEPLKEDALFLLDFFNPLSWINTAMLIKKNKPDLLLITWVSPVQAPIYFIITLLLKSLTEIKITYICHNVLPHETTFYDKPLTKLALSQGNSFIVHSKEDRDNLKKLIKTNNIILGFHPTYDIFNTGKKYDIKAIKKALNLNNKVLLFFGYIRPYKGLLYLINAMPAILKSFPDTSLLVAGDFWSKDKQFYFDLVKKLKLTKHIVFINKYIANEEIGKYFAVADVAIFPYTAATQSGTLQVAIAFNKPIIATAVGGLKDVMNDGFADYIIKSQNSKDIVEKVRKFYKEKPKKENLLANKRTWDEYINLLKSQTLL